MEWISVEDRLPNNNDRLIFFNGVYIDFGVYYKKFYDLDDLTQENVTHWMPLPNPPKDK